MAISFFQEREIKFPNISEAGQVPQPTFGPNREPQKPVPAIPVAATSALSASLPIQGKAHSPNTKAAWQTNDNNIVIFTYEDDDGSEKSLSFRVKDDRYICQDQICQSARADTRKKAGSEGLVWSSVREHAKYDHLLKLRRNKTRTWAEKLKPLKCPFCEAIFKKYYQGLKEHVDDKHCSKRPATLKCQFCETEFEQYFQDQGLKEHEDKHCRKRLEVEMEALPQDMSTPPFSDSHTATQHPASASSTFQQHQPQHSSSSRDNTQSESSPPIKHQPAAALANQETPTANRPQFDLDAKMKKMAPLKFPETVGSSKGSNQSLSSMSLGCTPSTSAHQIVVRKNMPNTGDVPNEVLGEDLHKQQKIREPAMQLQQQSQGHQETVQHPPKKTSPPKLPKLTVAQQKLVPKKPQPLIAEVQRLRDPEKIAEANEESDEKMKVAEAKAATGAKVNHNQNDSPPRKTTIKVSERNEKRKETEIDRHQRKKRQSTMKTSLKSLQESKKEETEAKSAAAALSVLVTKNAHGAISGTKRGIIVPLVSKRPENNSKKFLVEKSFTTKF